MKSKLIVLCLTGFFSSIVWAGSSTDIGLIGRMTYNSSDKKLHIYKKDNGNWTADGCTDVFVDGVTFQGADGFLSVAMAAKMSKSSVSFFGDCDPQTKTFVAHSIIVE